MSGRHWKDEGEFETGCFTAEANNAALTVTTTQVLDARKRSLFEQLGREYGASGDEAIGTGRAWKPVGEFVEFFRDCYSREYSEPSGLRGEARDDFIHWLARDFERWFGEEGAALVALPAKSRALPTNAEGVIRLMTIRERTAFLPDYQLAPKLYAEVKRALEAMGGRWNTKTQGFVFADDDPRERIDAFFATGKKTSHKKEQQAFFTPMEVARRAAEIADLSDHHLVLEPSAGRGALVQAILERAPKCRLQAYELSEVYFPDLQRIRDGRPSEFSLDQADFLQVKPVVQFDRILMNPPYNKRQDFTHVGHAARFLKSTGRLTAILLAGKGETILKEAGLKITAVEPLPEKAFQASGTTVRTEIVSGVRGS